MQTTILGKTYEGRPAFGSLALRLLILEESGFEAKARELLDAHNRIADVFGGPRVDLARHMTTLSMEGLITASAVRS